MPWLDDVVRAKRPLHLPVVLTRDEVRAVLQRLDGVPRLGGRREDEAGEPAPMRVVPVGAADVADIVVRVDAVSRSCQ